MHNKIDSFKWRHNDEYIVIYNRIISRTELNLVIAS